MLIAINMEMLKRREYRSRYNFYLVDDYYNKFLCFPQKNITQSNAVLTLKHLVNLILYYIMNEEFN